MKKMFLALLTGLLFVALPQVQAAKFKIDEDHSEVTFKVKHLMISNVTGNFGKFSGMFEFDEKKPKKWNAMAEIEAASINTNHAKRDVHLKDHDFLDVEKHPKITFKSTGVKVVTGKSSKVDGVLTLHGVEKPVTLDLVFNGVVKDPWENTRAGFEATTTINRKDFGITWNKALDGGGLMIGEEIKITIQVEGILEDGKKKDKKKKKK